MDISRIAGAGRHAAGEAFEALQAVAAAVFIGALTGLAVSFGGGLYVFLGGATAFPRTVAPSAMAVIPSFLVGALGAVLGLLGGVGTVGTRLGWDRMRGRP